MFAAYIEVLYRQATGESVSQDEMEQASGRVSEVILGHSRRFTSERR